MNSSKINLALPLYSLLPAGCVSDLIYSAELFKKISDLFMGNQAPFDLDLGLPSFFKVYKDTGISIYGKSFRESWNFFKIRIVATD